MSGLPKHVPMPLEWHPAYRDRTSLLDWVEGRAKGYPLDRIVLPLPRRVRFDFAAAADVEASAPAMKTMTMRREQCGAFAPYVGRPFVYRWWVGIDDVGRAIAGEAHIEYVGDLPLVDLAAFVWDRLDEGEGVVYEDEGVTYGGQVEPSLERRAVGRYLSLTAWDEEAEMLLHVIRVIGARYSYHPGYDERWKPA